MADGGKIFSRGDGKIYRDAVLHEALMIISCQRQDRSLTNTFFSHEGIYT